MEAEGDGPEDIGLTSWKKEDAHTAAKLDSPDAELAPVLEQLRRTYLFLQHRHGSNLSNMAFQLAGILESMQGNHEQIDGLADGMQSAQAALDDVLFRHASAPQYAAL